MKELADFIFSVNKLKETKRSGWVERGCAEPESVAEHSFMSALLSFILSRGDLDRGKAIKMALVHDIGESIIGDIITRNSYHMTLEEKIRKERKAINGLTKNLGKLGEEIRNLWEEFEEGKTREAKFVRQVDKIEMFLQAVKYHNNGSCKKDVAGFWDENNLGLITDPYLIDFLKTLPEIKRVLDDVKME